MSHCDQVFHHAFAEAFQSEINIDELNKQIWEDEQFYQMQNDWEFM